MTESRYGMTAWEYEPCIFFGETGHRYQQAWVFRVGGLMKEPGKVVCRAVSTSSRLAVWDE